MHICKDAKKKQLQYKTINLKGLDKWYVVILTALLFTNKIERKIHVYLQISQKCTFTITNPQENS